MSPLRSRQVGPFVLAAACVVSACESVAGTSSAGGAGGEDGGGGQDATSLACAAHTPGAPELNGDIVHDTAVTQEFTSLDQFLGRYLRGDEPTYEGTASITETLGVFGAPGAVATAHAVAALIIDSDTATLTVADPAAHQRVMFTQTKASPGVTNASHVFPDFSYPAGPSGATCAGCLPDLFTMAAAIQWRGADARFPGDLWDDGSVRDPAFDVTASVSIGLRTPCALTWDDVAVLNGGAFDYAQFSNEMVHHATGQVQTRAASFRMCDGEVVPYQLDVYVNLSNLFDYGLRNFTAGAPQVLCGGA